MKDKPKPLWEIAREWAAFAFSTLAIVISLVTAYLTTFRTVDELKVIVDRRPAIFFHDGLGRMMTYGSLSVVFINSGTRPISVLRASLYFGEAKTTGGRTECDGVYLDTDLKSLVIEEKKIIVKAISPTDPRYSVEGDDLQKVDGAYTFNPRASSLARGFLTTCISFEVATPSNAQISNGIELGTAGASKEKFVSTRLNTVPVVIWRKSGTIFSSK